MADALEAGGGVGATDFSSTIHFAQALLAAMTLAFGSAFVGLWLVYRRDAMRAAALAWIGLGTYSALVAANGNPRLPQFAGLDYAMAVVGAFTAISLVGVAYAVVAPHRSRRPLGVAAVLLSVLLCINLAAELEFDRLSRAVVVLAFGWAIVFTFRAQPSPGRRSMMAALALLILRPTFSLVALAPNAATQPAWYTALQITVTILAGFFTTTSVFNIEREATLGERLLLERSLAQSQRMDSLGRMAASVAHDFNNILTAVLAAGDAATDRASRAEEREEAATDLRAAVDRGQLLTRALLTFSRPQAATVEFDPFNRLEGVRPMLERLVGRSIQVRWDVAPPASAPVRVLADGLQFDQMLLNLAANGRDAMPAGGVLTVTANVTTDTTATSAETPIDGPCVHIAVSDTGCGMSAEVREHLFEPFFTTKPPGRGTGLGLATAFGFVRQAQGRVRVTSAPDQGSTFSILLPVRDAAA
jgi:signal transduction histidine kinase